MHNTPPLWKRLSIGMAVALNASACGESAQDEGSKQESSAVTWQTVIDGAPGALLRVAGSKQLGVYAVGADADGKGPLVYHITSRDVTRLETGFKGSLWWWSQVSDDALHMVGDDGLILRYVLSSRSFERIEAPRGMRLFGVWSRGDGDAWYVGGDLDKNVGTVMRGHGTTLQAPTALANEPLKGALFKVEGFASNDVWMVGEAGQAFHFDGESFSDESALTRLPLLSISGVDSSHVFAVGGAANGVILRRAHDQWVDETPAGLPQMVSVWATSEEQAYAVGFNGRMYERSGGTWREFDPPPPTYQDLHSVWVDADGGLWIAGGRLASDPPTDGVLLYYGRPGRGGRP